MHRRAASRLPQTALRPKYCGLHTSPRTLASGHSTGCNVNGTWFRVHAMNTWRPNKDPLTWPCIRLLRRQLLSDVTSDKQLWLVWQLKVRRYINHTLVHSRSPNQPFISFLPRSVPHFPILPLFLLYFPAPFSFRFLPFLLLEWGYFGMLLPDYSGCRCLDVLDF